MVRKNCIIALLVLLVIALTITGCTPSAPASTENAATPTSAAQSQSQSQAQASGKIYELTWGTYALSTDVRGVFMQEFKQRIEAKTNGRVKINLFYGEALGKQHEELRNVQNGISDMSLINPGVFQADFPLAAAGDLPFVMPVDRNLSLLNTIYDKYLSKDWKGVKILFPAWIESLTLLTKNKQVAKLEDMKGLQLRSPPGILSTITALGASPVSIPMTETYSALERGVVDGEFSGLTLAKSYEKHQVVRYGTIVDFNMGIDVVVMNQSTWNNLPPDLQQAFTDLTPWAQKTYNDAIDAEHLTAQEVLERNGVSFIKISDEERQKMTAATQSVVDGWVKTASAKGAPAAELVAELRAYKSRQ